MNKKGFGFSDTLEEKVKFRLESIDRELHATLKIIGNKTLVLETDSFAIGDYKHLKLSIDEKKEITCKSETKTYTLAENKNYGHLIWPRYVIHGDVDKSHSGIEVLISGVSEWIDQATDFEITESEIKKERPKNQFDEIISIDKDRYRVKSNCRCSIKKMENRDFLVSEYTTVQIIKLDGVIDPSEAEKLSRGIQTLFSLLLALPLSIEYVWFIDKEGQSRKPFYFFTPKIAGKPFNYPHECLIRPELIFSNCGWGRVFTNYFSPPTKDNFEDIWARLPSLFSYTDLWEYKILGYVTVLDSYCDKYARKKGKKLNSEEYKEIQQSLKLLVNNYFENLGSDYSGVKESFRAGIERIKNTDLPTFREKFKFTMEGIDSDIRSVINFSQEEFATIKRIRDSAAHGSPVKTRDGRDVSYEFRVRNKLLVLLMYLVYRDFGFSVIDYALSLRSSFSGFVRNAELDETLRDKLTGTVPFYSVDEDSFSSASDKKLISVGLKYYRSDNTYRFSHSVTQESQKWFDTLSAKTPALIDHIKENIDDSGVSDITYISQAYLVWEEQTIGLSGVCLVTYE